MSEEIHWAIIEIFGHKVIAGAITKDASLFPLLRIDVPATSTYPAYTVEYGPSAIFRILYVSEEVACKIAEALKVNPIVVYAPDLIPIEKHQRIVDELKQQLAKVHALPEPATNRRPSQDDDVEEDYDDDDDDDDEDDDT